MTKDRGSSFRARSRRRMSAFRRNDDGGVTVEFVLWFPFVIVLLAILTDFVFIYMTNASMWNAARESARGMAVRELTSEEARDLIEAKLIRGGTYAIKISTDAKSEVVSTVIAIGIDQASVFGILTPFVDDDIVAAVRMKKEPL